MKFPVFRKSRVKLRRWGYVYAGITLLTGFAAVNSGNNLLYIILAFLLALMALSGFVSFLNMAGLSILYVTYDEIYAKTPGYIKISIKNSKSFPSFLLFVSFKPEIADLHSPILYIPPKSEKNVSIRVYYTNRGPWELNSVYLYSPFPFGFTWRFKKLKAKASILVFPHIIHISGSVEEFLRAENGFISSSTREGTGGDFLGLREYRRGDPAYRIYWKKHKKEGDLYIKQFLDEGNKKIILHISENASEKLIERTASIACRLLEQGSLVGLKTDRDFIPPSTGRLQKLEILKTLALLGYD